MCKKFTIWYKTFTVEGLNQQDWNELPVEEVLGIVSYLGVNEYDHPLYEWFSGSDWYWMKDGKIGQSNISSDEPNIWLTNSAPEDAVCKKGIWTTDTHMNEVNQKMLSVIQGEING